MQGLNSVGSIRWKSLYDFLRNAYQTLFVQRVSLEFEIIRNAAVHRDLPSNIALAVSSLTFKWQMLRREERYPDARAGDARPSTSDQVGTSLRPLLHLVLERILTPRVNSTGLRRRGGWRGQSNDRLTERRVEIERTRAGEHGRGDGLERWRGERWREVCSRDMWEPLGLLVHTDSFEQL